MGKALKREVLYRALCGEQAELLLKLSLQAGPIVQINKVIDVLEQNYNQEIDVDNLAKEVNLSVSSFYRLFKDVTSDTPVQYLKKIRLNKAKEMIITQKCESLCGSIRSRLSECFSVQPRVQTLLWRDTSCSKGKLDLSPFSIRLFD